MCKWNSVLTTEQMEAQYALTASIDPSFARADRQFWESRTAPQLRALKAGAWDACEPDTYQRAASYLALSAVAA
jgi:hypothetical protein